MRYVSAQTASPTGPGDWLTFTVGSYDNKIIPRHGEVPVVSPFVLENGEWGKLKVNLAANVSIEWLADILEGLSIANLKEVLQQAINHVIGEAASGQTPVIEQVHVIEARHMIESET